MAPTPHRFRGSAPVPSGSPRLQAQAGSYAGFILVSCFNSNLTVFMFFFCNFDPENFYEIQVAYLECSLKKLIRTRDMIIVYFLQDLFAYVQVLERVGPCYLSDLCVGTAAVVGLSGLRSAARGDLVCLDTGQSGVQGLLVCLF